MLGQAAQLGMRSFWASEEVLQMILVWVHCTHSASRSRNDQQEEISFPCPST